MLQRSHDRSFAADVLGLLAVPTVPGIGADAARTVRVAPGDGRESRRLVLPKAAHPGHRGSS
jgi:hypothetical protein